MSDNHPRTPTAAPGVVGHVCGFVGDVCSTFVVELLVWCLVKVCSIFGPWTKCQQKYIVLLKMPNILGLKKKKVIIQLFTDQHVAFVALVWLLFY